MSARAEVEKLAMRARQAARSGDWRTTDRCARQILRHDTDSAEGYFLSGLVAKAGRRPSVAEKAFTHTLKRDATRYDAGIELAELLVRLQRNREALELLRTYEPHLGNSPLYLEMAASAYTRLDLHERAWPLYRKACGLQPGVERFQAGLAASAAFLGRLEEARTLYRELLRRNPRHQRFHYQLAQLTTATDFRHVEEMKSVLEASKLPPARNIFLYYALGKELEDLGQWDEAFRFYEAGGDAAKSTADYRVETDIRLIDEVIDTCHRTWLRKDMTAASPDPGASTPVFIVGLPRTGTTLTERILASHSRVCSVGETFFLPLSLRIEAGMPPAAGPLSPEAIEAASKADPARIAGRYLESIAYKLGSEQLFIEKLPENYLYLGFIAKAFPHASIVHLRRHPLDACFAMFKQSYFRYAYSLDDVGRYYAAYHRLMSHWRALLGDRLTEVCYEALVRNPEPEIRKLLGRLGLEFEASCLDFYLNPAASRTASAAQVRERIHSRSVNRWTRFEGQLAPLKDRLEAEGISTDIPFGEACG